MSETSLFTRFHISAKYRSFARSSFTLAKYVERYGDSDLSKLATQVNQSVYTLYARAQSVGSAVPFDRFMLERCCGLADTLNTPEYQKAMSMSERKSAINSWIRKFMEAEKKTPQLAPAESQHKRDAFGDSNTRKDSVKASVPSLLDFYNKYSADDVSSPLATPSKAPMVRTGVVVEPRKSNIVVQPPKKNSGDVPKNKKTSKSHVDDCVGLLKQQKYAEIPRKHLNTVIAHLSGLLEDCTSEEAAVHLPLYAKALDLSHSGFDACDPEALAGAIKMCKECDIENLPKRERRALVDLIERGAPEVLNEIKSKDNDAFDHLMKNATKLHLAADEDLLSFAPKIASVLAEIFPTDEVQTYAVGHNDTAALRLLLKSQSYDKLAKYMQSMRLKEGTENMQGPRPFKNIANMSWDPKLSHTKPYEKGTIKIFASAPFTDAISFFRTWLANGGVQIKANSVFLAPTDETIISQGMLDKWAKMAAPQQQKWLLSHQAKSNATTSGLVKKLASGEGSWITQYKTVYGQNVKAVVRTKVVHDEARNASFIPIGRILTE